MPPSLIDHSYRPPRLRVGDTVRCEYKGRDVEVALFGDAPMRWPTWRGNGGKQLPILAGDLVRAVRQESEQAVCHWWGVSRDTVKRWRRALGVGRMNPGTTALWKELAPRRLPPEARRKGGEALRRKWRGG